MEEIIRTLFNTNHEAPNLWVIVVLAFLALVLSLFGNYVKQNMGRRTRRNPLDKKKK